MKMVTLTFHNALNYGTVLQAYALQRSIAFRYPQNQVGVLDYRNPNIEKSKLINVTRSSLKGIVSMLITSQKRYKKLKCFQLSTDDDKSQVQKSVDKYIDSIISE